MTNTPFDLKLVIASYPKLNGTPSDELLRDKYPELAFIFDEMRNLRDMIEDHSNEIDSAHEEAYDEGYAVGLREGKYHE
jgi:flagellar biosynthesis/type III secretory pathway protein FliH